MGHVEEGCGEDVGGEGQADDVALHLFAALVGEEGLLGRGFHAFGDDGELHAVAQGDDGAHDGGIVGVVGQAADEGLVDFQEVQGQALEITQGRVASAKVVDGQLYAQALEFMQHFQGFFGLAHDEVFGDLQLQAVRLQAVVPQ